MPTHYDTNKPYDGGLRYSDGATAGVRKSPMKTKVDLRNKTDAEIVEMATQHQTAMTGNANFASPLPTAADFTAVLAAASTALANVATKYTEWRTAVSEKDEAILALKTALMSRGAYVDVASEGDEAEILSSGLGVRTAATPPQPLPAPSGVSARMGAMEGTLVTEWDVVPGAGSYVIECSPNVLPRVFAQVKIATRTDYTATALTSGQRYIFRVAAVGPLGQGPWSDEAGKMAP